MMVVTAAALRELHRIHRQLSDLRERLARGPKQVRAHETRLASARQTADEKQALLKAARISSDHKQLSLKASEEKIQDWKRQLNTCGTNREYQALQEQIAAAEMANSVLADEILEGLERIDELSKQATQVAEQVSQKERELAETRAKVDEGRERIESEIARVDAELAVAEKQLPADFRDGYDRVVRAKGEEALAEVSGDACGGCYQQLTPNVLNELTLGRPVFCKGCGRLLYLPEDRVFDGAR